MKISIVTFHCAHNYGAVLQAYALQEYLRSSGHQAHIVDYRPDKLMMPYRLWNKHRYIGSLIQCVKALIIDVLTFCRRSIKSYRFERFISQYIKPILSERAHNADVIVVGSDQIWNHKFTNWDKTYFGIIGGNNSLPVISYAASMEDVELTNSQQEELKKLLSHINYISVREKILKLFLENILSKPILQVLDPTLLINPSTWKHFVKSKPIRDYLLIYDMKNRLDIDDFAQPICQKNGYEIKKINPEVHKEYRKGVFQTLSPIQFVNLFGNAQYVVTTSFHGTAFALIFNIPFVVVKCNDNKESRLISLLHMLDLDDRIVDSPSKLPKQDINWGRVNARLTEARKESRCFLKNALDGCSK